MEQLTKNQAVATSQEAVQNQNEPQLRDENAHNDKSVHGVLNPTYQAGLRRDAVQPDIEAERKKRDEIEAGKSYCSRRFGGATCDDKSAQIYARFDKNDWRIQADGWFIVFDTLTLADDRLEAFYDNPNALRDYFRDIGRMVLAAEGRKANDSHADC